MCMCVRMHNTLTHYKYIYIHMKDDRSIWYRGKERTYNVINIIIYKND